MNVTFKVIGLDNMDISYNVEMPSECMTDRQSV